MSQWRLLDLFLLMLVVAAAYRLLGWSGAVFAAIDSELAEEIRRLRGVIRSGHAHSVCHKGVMARATEPGNDILDSPSPLKVPSPSERERVRVRVALYSR